MKFYDLLQFGVCVLSILAAGFWLRSATTAFPNLTANLRSDGTGPFPDALREQSRWSAAGARVPAWRLFPNRFPLCCHILVQADPLPSPARTLCPRALHAILSRMRADPLKRLVRDASMPELSNPSHPFRPCRPAWPENPNPSSAFRQPSLPWSPGGQRPNSRPVGRPSRPWPGR